MSIMNMQEPNQTAMTTHNPLKQLEAQGQSVWLDYIRRSLLTGGGLKRRIEEDGLGGVTSNPSIFEKAIVESSEYRDLLDAPGSKWLSAKELYEKIAIGDIQDAADLLRPVYDRSGRRDGYVSLEVSPLLAHDASGTVEEAERLWKTVGRENLMVKVPATEEGTAAVGSLIGKGININVTLLFSVEAYARIAEAYMLGLEEWASRGGDLSRVASVASFFISRIDTAVDHLLDLKAEAASSPDEQASLQGLRGHAAIASAKLAYQHFHHFYGGERWGRLVQHGARPQRLLWASTSTKNPAYRDVMYVEELIGPDTVNTIPPATMDAFLRPRQGAAKP